MSLAGEYDGLVVMGLNRGHDDLENTIEAARVAVENIGSLKAVEVGNEPDCELILSYVKLKRESYDSNSLLSFCFPGNRTGQAFEFMRNERWKEIL